MLLDALWRREWVCFVGRVRFSVTVVHMTVRCFRRLVLIVVADNVGARYVDGKSMESKRSQFATFTFGELLRNHRRAVEGGNACRWLHERSHGLGWLDTIWNW